jgi:hypothetical protein
MSFLTWRGGVAFKHFKMPQCRIELSYVRNRTTSAILATYHKVRDPHAQDLTVYY